MPGEALIERYTSRERNVLAARGAFGELFAAWLEHARAWIGEPDGLAYAMMRQGLAAAALYLTCRPRDEQTAWTVNLPEPPLNVFFTADAAAGRVVGRTFLDHVRAKPSSRLFVQLARPRGEPHVSVIDVTGFDVLSILEQYYAQSEQATARFFEREGDTFLMLMALPGVEEAWLRSIDAGEAEAFIDGPETRLIERRAVAFGCSCDERRVIEVTSGMFRDRLDELFGGEEEIEIYCPRCGRAYAVTRPEFERARAEGGD